MGKEIDPANAGEWKFNKTGGHFTVVGYETPKSVAISIIAGTLGKAAPTLALVAPKIENRMEGIFSSRRVCVGLDDHVSPPDREFDPDDWRKAGISADVTDPNDIEQLGRMLRSLGRELVALGRDRKRRAKEAEASPAD